MQFSISTVAAFASVLTYASAAAIVENRAVAQVTGWDYQGCKTDSVQARALNGSFYFDDLMTVDKCNIACKNFNYMAVEYSHECFCGNTVNPATTDAPEADCSYKCSGKPGDNCGAAPRINLYKKSTTTARVTTIVPAFNSVGCFTDNTNNRALKGAVIFDSLMTNDMCAALCTGWQLFGTEFGRECYCGNLLTIGTFQRFDAECSQPCAGRPAQKCGDSLRLNLFTYTR